ncbi:3'-5' exonuclease KapD [Bacillus sp. B15-48]|uniref:3'-5' exonuclease KapD n=1 Tax=Bacillus sp. B15-48 TaxID=1548601 RepID=UPI0019400BE2|nr:3'-5' exonuclease KapD [Bacillus sp. B15-48]MBM4760709.1 3'-5' exonuclease KapD [Bacillus sp. B15-48]
MKKKEREIFIDFEFTMPDKNGKKRGFFQEIIEAGLVVVENGEVMERFSSFVVPNRFPLLSNRCKSFLNISQKQVDDGISFHELVNKLRMLEDNVPGRIITWGNMDMKVLRDNCRKVGFSFPFIGDEIDFSLEYKRFFGNKNQTGLWRAVQEYGREGTGKHHRALDDALTTYHIYKLVEQDKQYLKKPKPPTIGDRIDLSKLYNKFA